MKIILHSIFLQLFNSGAFALFAGAFGIAILIIMGIALIPVIFYLLTLQNTLKEVSIENQKMPPGQVWLMLIPVFGNVWSFIVVTKIADSLKAEFEKRNIPVNEVRPGYGIGLAHCILACCAIVPIAGALAGLAGFICWIIYWVKIAGYKTKLEQSKAAM